MTYTELVTELQNYLGNTFSTADINTCIKQAEIRIFSTVTFAVSRKTATLTLSTGVPYLNCPDDFLASHALAVVDGTGAYRFLLNKDMSYMREAYPSPAYTGLPRVYAIMGVQTSTPLDLRFIVAPTPDANYSVELTYYYYPESITTSVDGRSWLGDNFDSVLLYGALVEGYTFMKGEEDLIKLYDSKYKEALLLAKRLGDGAEQQDVYRSGFQKTPVN